MMRDEPRACGNCGAGDLGPRSHGRADRCGACFTYRWRHGRERPASAWDRAPRCWVCRDRLPNRSREICARCYDARYGQARRLTPQQAQAIRHRHQTTDVSMSDLGRQFGVSRSTISRVLHQGGPEEVRCEAV